MNYASDPYWAHKEHYGPEKRQAYENQVMADRAAAERHRSQLDAVAIAGGVAAFGAWYGTRAQRKADKLRRAYDRDHRPGDYDRRRFEYYSAVEQLQRQTENDLYRLEVDARQVEMQLPLAGTAKTHRTLKSRLDALRSMMEDKRLALTTGLEALSMKYGDVLEYDRTMASF